MRRLRKRLRDPGGKRVVPSGQNFRDTDLFQRSLKLGLIFNASEGTGQRPVLPDGETREAVFHIGGMWCASCGWLIEHSLTRLRGIAAAEVMFSSDLLKVRYCPRYVPRERVVERVASLGYRAEEYTGSSAPADAERKDLLLRTGIAAFLSMNVMTFSLVVYASYFEPIAASYSRYIPFLLMGLATPSVFYCAAPVLRIAWAGALSGRLRMESLLAMGILMAYGYSAAETFRGGHRVYFDTPCAIVTLVLTGKVIERGAKARAMRALTLLHRLMPTKARVIDNGQDGRERFVSVEALQPGAIFRVKSGERVAAGGIVVEGRSHADESVLTGESAPVAKTVGSSVVSGSINTGGVLEIRVTRAGADSTLERIVRTVEQAAASRTKIERSVDRVARHLHSRRTGAGRHHVRRMASPHRKAGDRADARHRGAGDRLPLRARHRDPAGALYRRGRRRTARHPGERHAGAGDHPRRAHRGPG